MQPIGNSPNPFGSSTAIHFELPRVEAVSLQVHDVLGRRVAMLLDRLLPAGMHELVLVR